MSTNHEIQWMVEQIQHLQLKNRHLRVFSILSFTFSFTVFALLVCEIVGIDVMKRKVVKAESFIVEGQDGRIQAEFTSFDDRTILSFYDDVGKPRLALSVTEREPGVHIYDENGIRRAAFGISRDGPSLVFLRPFGPEYSGFVSQSDGSTQLLLNDLDQTERFARAELNRKRTVSPFDHAGDMNMKLYY